MANFGQSSGLPLRNVSMANSSNSSTSNATDEKIYNKLFSVPIILTVYTVVLIVAITGNALVCWIVRANPTMHTITNYLLVNLAVSDLILTMSTMFHVVDFVVKDLHLGDVGCKFQINMVNIPYGSSCLTLTVVAIERYVAVCKPLRFKDVKDKIKWIIPSIWLLSGAVYFPFIYFCGTKHHKEGDQLTCDCNERWPSSRAQRIYGIFIVCVFYIFPLVIIVGFYSSVIRQLRATPPGAGAGQTSVQMYKSRQKVVKMLLVTIATYFVLWTPYNVLYFLKQVEVDYRSVYSYVWYPSLLLAFLSCVYNPVVYCLMGKSFREGFKSALCCCRNCHLPEILGRMSSKTPSSRSVEEFVLQ